MEASEKIFNDLYGAAWNRLTESEQVAAFSYLESCFFEPWMTGFIVTGGR